MSNYLPDNSLGREQVRCPRCGSVQLAASKRGYSGCGGILGYLIFGWIGLLLGFLGHSNPRIVCLNCGNEFGQPSGGSCLALFIIPLALMLPALVFALV